MRIEIWADVVCGWAYIGKRRVEKALDGLDAEVVWRPFRIDPTAPAQAVPYEEAMADPMADAALSRCAPDLTPGETRARMSRVAADAGFADGGALLDAGAGDDLVRELLLRGKAIGVKTSPTIVAGGDALAGAQPPEVIREFVLAARPARRLPEEVERYRHAESLLDQRDPLGALTLLTPLLGEHGDDRNVLTLAARAYYLSAQLGRARTTLERLVAAAPDDAYARHLLGRTLQRQGHAEEAEPHLRMAAVMSPDYA